MQEIKISVDAELYRELEILAEITDMTIGDVAISMLEFAVKLREDEIEKHRNDEKFNQFLEEINS